MCVVSGIECVERMCYGMDESWGHGMYLGPMTAYSCLVKRLDSKGDIYMK